MSTYNEKLEWIELSINSILNQTYPYFEFIVVIDNPENIELKNLLDSYALKDSRLNILYNDVNVGLVNSLNKALEYCSGDYILRMDADDISLATRIEKQIQYLEQNKLDFVFSSMMYIDEVGQDLFPTNTRELESEKVKRLLSITNISNHPTWFSKKEVYEELGGYRDVRYCEDYDFSLRALSKGFKIGKMPNYVLKYRIRSNGISQSNALEQYLISKILTKSYNENTINNIEKITYEITKINNKLTHKSRKSFCLMNNYLTESISLVKERKRFNAFFKLIKAIKTNRYAICRYIDIVKINLNR